MTTLALVPTISDALNGADQNPLSNGGAWTYTAQGGSGNQLQILDGYATAQPAPSTSASKYVAASAPNNQYAQAKVAAWDGSASSTSTLEIQARLEPTGPIGQGYVLGVGAPGNGDGVNCSVILAGWTGPGQTFSVTQNIDPVEPGDVFALAVIGWNVYALRNGTVILEATDPGSASALGAPGLGVVNNAVTGDTGWTEFVAGSAAIAPNPGGYSNWPQFQPEPIAAALFALLQQAAFPFVTYDRKGAVPENVPAANQPYLGLIQLGAQQVENQAQGLEKWLLHFRVLVYIRADASSSAIPATQLNNALQAIVEVMRSTPPGERQTLGGTVDNAWIEGDILEDTGIIDQQCALLIPIVVDCGL